MCIPGCFAVGLLREKYSVVHVIVVPWLLTCNGDCTILMQVNGGPSEGEGQVRTPLTRGWYNTIQHHTPLRSHMVQLACITIDLVSGMTLLLCECHGVHGICTSWWLLLTSHTV